MRERECWVEKRVRVSSKGVCRKRERERKNQRDCTYVAATERVREKVTIELEITKKGKEINK